MNKAKNISIGLYEDNWQIAFAQLVQMSEANASLCNVSSYDFWQQLLPKNMRGVNTKIRSSQFLSADGWKRQTVLVKFNI